MRRKDCVVPQCGFQLIELLIALAVISLLAIIAVPSYSRYRDKADNAIATADIVAISQAVERYYVDYHAYPDSLNQVNMDTMQANIASGTNNTGTYRKDKFLHPINTDYDLYSMGKDGATQTPLTAGVSQDDIVRANNGAYIGLASDY
ncbi:MAG: type II secretion system protein GspG [Gammaproteobacteria bacterium]